MADGGSKHDSVEPSLVTLIGVEKKETVLAPLLVLQEVLMRITGLIAKLAPVGVFALIASAIGTIDSADLARLQVFIVLYTLIALALGLWVLPGLITALRPLRYEKIVRALRIPLITAFATGSLLVVIPMLIVQCRQLILDDTIVRSTWLLRSQMSIHIRTLVQNSDNLDA
jgi:Na+/H+-dicarboxylate symporter